MGVPIEGCTHMYGDNMSTIHNTQCPESQLKKKPSSICYHAVREAVAMGEMLSRQMRILLKIGVIITQRAFHLCESCLTRVKINNSPVVDNTPMIGALARSHDIG